MALWRSGGGKDYQNWGTGIPRPAPDVLLRQVRSHSRLECQALCVHRLKIIIPSISIASDSGEWISMHWASPVNLFLPGLKGSSTRYAYR